MVGTKRAVGLLTAIAALAASGCGSAPEPSTDTPRTLTVAGVERVDAAADAPVDRAVAGMRSFAESFGKAIATDGEHTENTVYSPVSLAYAFAMLRAAADGATARQLDAAFGYPDPGVHAAFNALSRDIVTTAAPPDPDTTRDPEAPPQPPVVSIANGLFLQEGRQPREDFLRTLAEQYGAGARAVDFTSADAKRIIDAWVREQTADRIDKLFDELKPTTIAVLANAVYLKADWLTPFDPGRTADEDFRLADGSTVRAPMMHLIKPQVLGYQRGDGWQAVRLPYAGDELAMWILLPDAVTAAPRFSADQLAAVADAGRATVDVVLPKFDFGTDVGLLPVLGQLGLTDVGDLPGISPSAYVEDAVHRANITVDEFGTEAAAVTGIAVDESAALVDVTFRADRPFAFAVEHEPSGAPVFVGTVTDPTR